MAPQPGEPRAAADEGSREPSAQDLAPREAPGRVAGPAAAQPGAGREMAGEQEARPMEEDMHAPPAAEAQASDGWRHHFQQLCQGDLELDAAACGFASDILEACHPPLEATLGSLGSHEDAEAERLWGACAVFLARKLWSRGPGAPATALGTAELAAARGAAGPLANGGGAGGDGSSGPEIRAPPPPPAFTLSQLLHALDLPAADFFRELNNFLAKASPVLDRKFGAAWERQVAVAEVQANFAHTLLIFNHYLKVYGELFHGGPPVGREEKGPDAPGGSSLGPLGAGPAEAAEGAMRNPQFRLGWLLFLLLRDRLLRPFPDLVSCTNALLCVLILLMLHAPAKSHKFRFQDASRFPKRKAAVPGAAAGRGDGGADGAGERLDLVASVCSSYKASEPDIWALLQQSAGVLSALLACPATPLAAWQQAQGGSQAEAGAPDRAHLQDLDPDGLLLLEGLLTRPDFARRLDAAYEVQQQQLQSPEAWGEVDGRLLPLAAWAGASAGAGGQCPRQLLGAASILPMVPGARAGGDELLLPAPLLAPTASASAPLPATPAPSRRGVEGGALASTPTRTHALPPVGTSPFHVRMGGGAGATTAAASPFGALSASGLSTPGATATPLPRHFLTRLQPATPISSAMTTASWLRTVVAPSPAEPGPELLKYLRACRRDLTAEVVARTTLVSEHVFAFVAHHTSADSSSPLLAGAETASGDTPSATAETAPGDTPSGPPPSGGPGRDTSTAYDASWPELRRQESVKLYYRVLGRLCSAEAERVRGQDLTALLGNDRFHRSLLACCAELVLASHKATAHTFPSILEPAGVSALDLDKAMESLVRHEDSLPGELRKHLHACDERILEALAWAKGSSLYLALIAARRHLAAEVVRLGLLPPHAQAPPQAPAGEPPLGEAASRAGLLPAKAAAQGGDADRRSAAGSASGAGPEGRVAGGAEEDSRGTASPPREGGAPLARASKPRDEAGGSRTSKAEAGAGSSPASEWGHCAEAQLLQFSQKVLKLGLVRARALCERLRLPPSVLEMVYRVVEHCVCAEVQLLFRRHLDQIILCALYGVCKVKQLPVTFKDIIGHYRKQPQCKPQVFRNVFIGDAQLPAPGGGPPVLTPVLGDIIRFYNEVFVPATKSFLLHLGQQQQQQQQQQQPQPQPQQQQQQLHQQQQQQQQQGQQLQEQGQQQQPQQPPPLMPPQQHDQHRQPQLSQGLPQALPPSSPRADSASPMVSASAQQHAALHAQSSPQAPAGSPRRVSAAHNVYVSPLASAKAEALLSSPHRPQMCAQLGVLGADTNSLLSTSGGRPAGANGHGLYASPARKLAAINSRISATRRLGKLDFSDAMEVEGAKGAGGASSVPATVLLSSQGPGLQGPHRAPLGASEQHQAHDYEGPVPRTSSAASLTSPASLPPSHPQQAACPPSPGSAASKRMRRNA